MVEITREQLYALVWSAPATKVAQEIGISGPGLAKACRKHHIPVPERGYWARVAAGKKVTKRLLPPRGLGMSATVWIGAGRFDNRIPEADLDPDRPPPPPPEFPESMDSVRTRVTKLVGRVRPVRALEDAVPAVRLYLAADDERRRKVAGSKYYWESPKFESSTEQRRLRILNSLFLASMRLGYPGSISGPEARQLSIRVGEQHVAFTLEPVRQTAARRSGRGRPPKHPTRLQLSISRREYPGGAIKEWADTTGATLEGRLSEILAEILVTGEQFQRDHEAYRHRWTLEKREREVQERRQRAEALERQLIARIEAAKQARMSRVLKDVDAWRRARDIRAYVAAVEAAYADLNPEGSEGSDPPKIAAWAAWARSVADSVDPIAERRAVFDPQMAEGGGDSSTMGRGE